MELLIWFIILLLTGYTANEKNRSVVGWVIASAFFGFIPLVILLFLDNLY